MNFANRLTELRKNKGITQEQLANVLGLTPAAIGLYEQGRRTRIDNEVVIKLANFFNVSIDYLYGVENTTAAHPVTEFTYAMYEESKALTDEDKQTLLALAKTLAAKNK